MAQTLGSVAVGSIVKIKENGAAVNYIVVHQGRPSSSYDTSCDGTWLLRQDIAENRKWDSGNSNVLESSDIQSYLNNTWINRYDTDIRNAIKQVKIPYRQNGGSGGTDRNGANGLSCKIFLLSGYEVGWTTSNNQYFPVDGAKLAYFLDGTSSSADSKRVAKLNGSAANWWLRSPYTNGTNNVWSVYPDGDCTVWDAHNSYGVRPALILPSTFLVSDDGSITTNTALTLTAPQMVMQGQSATVSWTAVEGADSYTLQRKANTDADWTQVYSGANLSYTETVGTWTSLQYRVQGVFDGTPGGWATSGDIQIVSASALVISGQDGDLGILTNDVQYSISSDQTSPTIDVTVEVNGGEYASFQATSGQTYSVSVLDLPTGTGSIVITATTEVSSSPVTVTRTWTYSKTAITFPETGSVADLTQQGNTIWAKTIAEAVRTPGIWGGNLGLALSKLARSVLYNRTQQGKYAEVTVNLAGKSEGDIISLPENGKMVEFYVAKLDYESALNGAGRVLLVRKDTYDDRVWDNGNVNAYASSDLDSWFNSTYKNMLDADIRSLIGTTKIRYTPGNGNWTVGTLERAVFALSATELGQSASWFNVEGSALPIASTLRIAYRNGSATTQWTRSPLTSGTFGAVFLYSDGNAGSDGCDISYWSRPAFTLPTTFTATYYVDQDGTIQPSQEYEEAGTFTDISGGTIPMVSIETGSYVGTGTYGSGNPTTLIFDFPPTLVIVQSGESTVNDPTRSLGIFISGNTSAYVMDTDNSSQGFNSLGARFVTISFSGNTMSIVGNIDQAQLNVANMTYRYVAFG